MATEDTLPLWPSNVFRHSPSVFHIFTVLSHDPLTIRSGPKMATEDTPSLWPSNVFRHSPSVFHIFTVLSYDPLTIRSGPKMATEIQNHCGLPMSLGTRHPYSISLRYCPRSANDSVGT